MSRNRIIPSDLTDTRVGKLVEMSINEIYCDHRGQRGRVLAVRQGLTNMIARVKWFSDGRVTAINVENTELFWVEEQLQFSFMRRKHAYRCS